MARQIALLRAINLGSRQRMRMADLRDVLVRLGYGDVRTYLQSGNVVFTSGAPPATVQLEIEQRLATELGIETQVLVRTRDELADVVKRDPLGHVASDPKRYQVSFLSAELDPLVVRELNATDVAPEQFLVDGREIYAWHPNGIQRSPLAKLLSERRLGVTATARNWNTVTSLLALADE